jgi:hypothetical protein
MSCLNRLNVPCRGFKKTYKMVFDQKKIQNFNFKNLVIKKSWSGSGSGLDLDSATD